MSLFRIFFSGSWLLLMTGCLTGTKGRYLLSTQGDIAGSDHVYLLRSGSKMDICGRYRGATPCMLGVATADSYYVLRASGLAEITKASGQLETISLPTTDDAQVSDLSMSSGGTLLTVSTYSASRKESQIWVYNIASKRWTSVDASVQKPSWLTRPMTDDDSGATYFLIGTMGASGLSSKLMRIGPTDGIPTKLLDENVAAYTLKSKGELLLWTQRGLELLRPSGDRTLLAAKELLSGSERLRPGAISWDGTRGIVAIAAYDRLHKATTIIELDAQMQKSKRVGLGSLGNVLLIQPVN